MMSAPDKNTRPSGSAELGGEQRQENQPTEENPVAQTDAAGQEDTLPTDAAEPKASKSNVCGVCNENPGKYKCPRCRMP